MNKISCFFTLLLLSLFGAFTANAQNADVFSYQTSVHDASGNVVANRLVHVRVSIMSRSAEGVLVYAEHSSAMADAAGWITVLVGDGVAIKGSFADIDWSRGPYFIRCDIDPDGGSNYKVGTTQQLLSVPYALYSAGGDYNNLTNRPDIKAEVRSVLQERGGKIVVEGMSREEVRRYVDSLMNDYLDRAVISRSNSRSDSREDVSFDHQSQQDKSQQDLQLAPAAINGLLPGEFSVSATTKVRFSQGNLRYSDKGRHAVLDGGTRQGTWSLMPLQYESPKSDTVWQEYLMWGNTGSMGYEFSGKEGYDFGLYNAIINGGNKPGVWRMLTAKEWDYLRNDRLNAAKKIALATVAGHKGIVLLPDDWYLPEECVFAAGSLFGYATNAYTDYQWKLMEQAGAVFLPAAGSMTGGSVYSRGTYGSYWSSTLVDSRRAYSFDFDDTGMRTIGNQSSLGLSVRLVQDAD